MPLVRDPKDGVRALRPVGRMAKKNPHKAMGHWPPSGEVLKRAVALPAVHTADIRNIIEAFQDAAAAVAAAVEASSFSITFDLPRTIALSYSWTS